MQKLILSTIIALSFGLGMTPVMADHKDGSKVTEDPSTDIANVYAWMGKDETPEENEVMNLIMTVYPNADSNSKFSTKAKYIFHINNSAAYDAAQTKTTIECFFSDTGKVTCAKNGTEILVNNVNGNTGAQYGVGNQSGTFKIATKLRKDPSYRDIHNFDLARAALRQKLLSAPKDNTQCPALDLPTQNSILNTFKGEAGGDALTEIPPQNAYKNQLVLAIIIQAAPSIIGEGPVYGVYGTTEKYEPIVETEQQ